MATFPLTWDGVGEKAYEAGVSKCVLYTSDPTVEDPSLYNTPYTMAEAWNGIINVTESPTGAETNKGYADNIPYLNIQSAEELEGSIEAYTFPDSWYKCDGYVNGPITGAMVGQQLRESFALSYRTEIGDDVSGLKAGYKIHIVYGCKASPSERSYDSINESPDGMTMSWDYTTTPVSTTDYGAISSLVFDSRVMAPAVLAKLEEILYGKSGDTTVKLPLPDALFAQLAEADTALSSITEHT